MHVKQFVQNLSNNENQDKTSINDSLSQLDHLSGQHWNKKNTNRLFTFYNNHYHTITSENRKKIEQFLSQEYSTHAKWSPRASILGNPVWMHTHDQNLPVASINKSIDVSPAERAMRLQLTREANYVLPKDVFLRNDPAIIYEAPFENKTLRVSGKHITFNDKFYFALYEGRIFTKPRSTFSDITGNETRNHNKTTEWQLFSESGLPSNGQNKNFHPPHGPLHGISVDVNHLLVLDEKGYLYDYSLLKGQGPWKDTWGKPPKRQQLNVDSFWGATDRINNTYFDDKDGHPIYEYVGVGMLCIVNNDDPGTIFYGDPWLDGFDFSFWGPHEGRAPIEYYAVSGSVSVIRYRDPETGVTTYKYRTADFDILRNNPGYELAPVSFRYSYDPHTSSKRYHGPEPGWLHLPPIMLANGEPAPTTGNITVFQHFDWNMKGSKSLRTNYDYDRIVRVSGWNEVGQTGYWNIPLKGKQWTFVPVPDLKIQASPITAIDKQSAILLPKRTKSYDDGSVIVRKGLHNTCEIKASVSNFHLDYSPATLFLAIDGEQFSLTMHIQKVYFEGYNQATIIVPDDMLRSENKNVQAFLKQAFKTNAHAKKVKREIKMYIDTSNPNKITFTNKYIRLKLFDGVRKFLEFHKEITSVQTIPTPRKHSLDITFNTIEQNVTQQ